jgi:hypothetical protein
MDSVQHKLKKAPYRRPEFVVYGTIQELTRLTIGGVSDSQPGTPIPNDTQ